MKNKKGFTLLELVMIATIVGIMLYIAVPRLKFDTLGRYKADVVAKKIVTDLRRARSLAISDAAVNSKGFALEFVGTSPYTSYQIKNQNNSSIVDTLSIDISVTVTSLSGSSVKFGPLGDIQSGSSTQITVSSEGRIFTISIISATGAVQCVKS